MGVLAASDRMEPQVAVLGAGLAGIAVATRLARAGIEVVCIDPHPTARTPVGESLDWSAPQLLADLGFDRAELLAAGLATTKHHIRVDSVDGVAFELAPEPWFARRPLSFEIATLHLDRARFDRALLGAAERAGVRFLRERVRSVRVRGGAVEAVETEGTLLRARRYVDASGSARLVGRALALPVRTYGPPKVSLWTYLALARSGEGTTLHLGERDAYLQWLWEIPIAPDVLSLGLTLPAHELKRRIEVHGCAESVLRAELSRHERLRVALEQAGTLEVRARAFRCSVQQRVSGPNWFAIGEAAAMVDPLTSNGFTFALRFAEHAADLIEASLAHPELPAARRRIFESCLRGTAHAFNDHIERIAYQPGLRRGLGVRRATLVYVLFGYVCNALCQRLRPRGPLAAQALNTLLAGFRMWRAGWTLEARRRTRAA